MKISCHPLKLRACGHSGPPESGRCRPQDSARWQWNGSTATTPLPASDLLLAGTLQPNQLYAAKGSVSPLCFGDGCAGSLTGIELYVPARASAWIPEGRRGPKGSCAWARSLLLRAQRLPLPQEGARVMRLTRPSAQTLWRVN